MTRLPLLVDDQLVLEIEAAEPRYVERHFEGHHHIGFEQGFGIGRDERPLLVEQGVAETVAEVPSRKSRRARRPAGRRSWRDALPWRAAPGA